MAKRLNLQFELSALAEIDDSLPAVDRDVARWLSERVAEGNRLAFARTFAHAVLGACWRARDMQSEIPPVPETVELMPLSTEAVTEAERLGAAISKLESRAIAHFVGITYATALPEPYRASHGIFYTPPELVERLLAMVEEAGVRWDSARVLDPACGGGAFLLAIAHRMIAALDGTEPAFILQQLGARLRGIDVDAFGAWLAQAMLEIALRDLVQTSRKAAPTMVETRDGLEVSSASEGIYDLVVGNPPYGRVSLSTQRRKLFARSLHGHANLYGLFTDAALRWVKEGGIVGYVTPTSMLSGLYYKSLRALISAEAPPLAVNFVTERNGVFTDVLQETMLTTYRRGGLAHGGTVGFITIAAGGGTSYRRAGTIVLPSRPEAPWLLPRTPDQAGLARRLRAMPYRLADYGYGVSTGPLVWNRFKSQFRKEPVPGAYPVVWAESVTADGRFVWRSEKRNHAPWFAANLPKDDWLLVDRPCVLLQRTTAKEQSRRLIAAELPNSFVRRHKGVTIENHLNMVRSLAPKPKIPASVIAALLNSAAVDEAFRCLNGSVAVSAFELEELPLPSPPVLGRIGRLVAAGASKQKIESVIAAAYMRDDAAASA